MERASLPNGRAVSLRTVQNEGRGRPRFMKEFPDEKLKSFGFEELFGKNVKGWAKDPKGTPREDRGLR